MARATDKQDRNTAPAHVNSAQKKRISVALQGGGSLGAYTWGVLDKLLEDGRIEFDGISGTSAGAVNAVALAVGLAEGGNQGARNKLREVWGEVGKLHHLSPYQANPWFDMFGLGRNNPWNNYLDWLRTQISPYAANPGNFNPLRNLLDKVFDYSVLTNKAAPKLFIAATNVKTGGLKLFHNKDMSTSAVLASACLPELFQAVKIGDEHYWDGGYAGNPNIDPLLDECKSSDVLMIQINPVVTNSVPTSAGDIADRVNEITFNTALLAELRNIEKMNQLIESGKLKPTAGLRPVRMHMIERPNVNLSNHNIPQKLNIDPRYLEKLFDLGRATAETWLENNFPKIGKTTSFNLPRMEQMMQEPVFDGPMVDPQLTEGETSMRRGADAAPPPRDPVPAAPRRRRL